ncbi:MAG: malonyl-CoA synthase, partial [Candidatus Competibacterales bacterium]
PAATSLFAQLWPAIAAAKDKAFIETPAGVAVGYDAIAPRTAQLAQVLRSRGVTPGDRVAVYAPKCPEALLLYLACLRMGAVYLPLNTAYTRDELGFFFTDAEPRLVVCDPKDRQEIEALAEATGVGAVETLGVEGAGSLLAATQRAPDTFEDVPRRSDDLAAILYTSGTTGRPKGAMLSHGNLASNAFTLVETWAFTPADRLIHALPIFHTHGLFVATNVALACGATLLLLPRFDPDAVLAWMPQATALMGVPTFYTRLLAHPGLTREAVANMRLFISGSAPLLAETHRAFFDRTGHAILERYGMTETNMNSSNPHRGERVPGSVGFPLPGVEIRIADPATGAVKATGEIGSIEIRGPNVFQGYWRLPDKTREEFRDDGFFISGDLGHYDQRGYLYIVGRAKDLVISGGFNVYPKEVELAIDELPGVVESAVFGVPHPDFGEGVTAAVVLAPGTPREEQPIIEDLAERLAKYKLPKRVLFVDELPRNTMGKVQKNRLREAHWDLYR